MSSRTALVLGATGGIGGAVARRLVDAGWRVRALHRGVRPLAAHGLEWCRGDAMVRSDVAAAAQGASLIVHAVNPPGYKDWHRLVLPMLENSIAAARGARILLPGTLYNYGPDAFPVIDEEAPQNPATAKGRIRAAMEERLGRAAQRGEAKALIVRAGDFFGPRAGNSWFSQVLVTPGKPLGTLTLPGAPGVGHQWSYIPDVAETMVRLADRADLPDMATYHMAGHWDPDGTHIAAAIARTAGRAGVRTRRFPWTLVGLAAPFVPLLRELREMRYLWETPVRLSNSRLVSVLGREPHTPLDQAVRSSLVGLGCIA
ncbi:MAG TPA: NAD-dependent epimerase/dehydratase family protein [Azospirillaceae bacterium]|nr:NAD-dependent epimerase/dehydratase family protein [Azospirillaceae bacterium]